MQFHSVLIQKTMKPSINIQTLNSQTECITDKFKYEQQTRKLELKVGKLQKKMITSSNKAYYLQKVRTKLNETISALNEQHLADENILKVLEVFIFDQFCCNSIKLSSDYYVSLRYLSILLQQVFNISS